MVHCQVLMWICQAPDSAAAGRKPPLRFLSSDGQSTRLISGLSRVRVPEGPFTREIIYRKETEMLRKLIEAVTLMGALFLPSGIESSIWCGVLGVILLVLFGLEVNAWEGGS